MRASFFRFLSYHQPVEGKQLMRKIDVLRTFNEISKTFLSGNYTLRTLSELLVAIRGNRYELTSEQINKLMEIPISVLANDVELRNKQDFKEFGHYFSGNITVRSDKYLSTLSGKFLKKRT